MFKKTTLFSFLMACSVPVLAQQDAHVHGIASMNIAVEGEELQIEFVTPSDGIVGFEYAPSTAAEIKAVADALSTLENPRSLFIIPTSAQCKLHEVEVERHAEGDHDDHAHDEHDHDKHAHDDHGHDEHDDDKHAHDEHGHDEHDDDKHAHDDHGHDEHDHDKHAHDEHGHDEHDHDKHENAEAEHSEFHAHYHFDCEGPVKTIELTLFKNWPRIETLRFQALTANGQTGGNSDASNPEIRLP